MKILIAVILFSIIILIHEFGHFLLAKLNRVTVIEFSLGMGPRLLSHVSAKSGTRYSVKAFPFGGSCMMKGEDEDDATEGSFGSKSVPARMSIVLAGPFFNFLLAFVCAVVIIGTIGYDEPVIREVTQGYPAQEAGIGPGDTITAIGSWRIHLRREISDYVTMHQKAFASGKGVEISWRNESGTHSARIVPADSGSGRYVLGVSVDAWQRTKGGVLQTVRYGVYEVEYWIRTTVASLLMIPQGELTLDDVSGPVGVVDVIGRTYEEARKTGWLDVWLNMLNLTVLLSANLGVMNLIPFPALDGGRFLLLLIEAVRRRKADQRIEAWVNLTGFALLMMLMAVILVNDLKRIFF